MKLFKYIILSLMGIAAAGCNDLDGDNSDYDFGDNLKSESPERLPDTYRLATYNIHRCTPAGSSVANYDNVAKAISLVDADVIALQELDSCTTRHSEFQLKELADRNGFKAYFCRAIKSAGGSYGVGIMSRNEPEKLYSQQLPGVEPRVFFVAEFADYVFICTHLCVSSADNREWSYDLITDYVKNNYASASKPVFLAGDLNATALPANALASWEVISAGMPTFPSKSQRLDYVLRYTGNSAPCEVKRTMVPNFKELRLADVSDHLPVFVDIAK